MCVLSCGEWAEEAEDDEDPPNEQPAMEPNNYERGIYVIIFFPFHELSHSIFVLNN